MYAITEFLIRFGIVKLPDSTSNGKVRARFQTHWLVALGCGRIGADVAATIERDEEFPLTIKRKDMAIGSRETIDNGLWRRCRHERFAIQREAINSRPRGGIQRAFVDADTGPLIDHTEMLDLHCL